MLVLVVHELLQGPSVDLEALLVGLLELLVVL